MRYTVNQEHRPGAAPPTAAHLGGVVRSVMAKFTFGAKDAGESMRKMMTAFDGLSDRMATLQLDRELADVRKQNDPRRKP